MTDRELWELAAKAASMDERFKGEGTTIRPNRVWDPLTNDRDAFRLAVELGIRIEYMGKEYCHISVDVTVGPADDSGFCEIDAVDIYEHFPHGCPYAATRRAITRAAAEIGRSMP